MSLSQSDQPFDRLRYSSIEERLAAIKQLCRGLEAVKVQYDSVSAVWDAFAPVNGKTHTQGKTPDEAVDKLWDMLTQSIVTLSYPDKEDQQFKWDGQRWVMI